MNNKYVVDLFLYSFSLVFLPQGVLNSFTFFLDCGFIKFLLLCFAFLYITYLRWDHIFCMKAFSYKEVEGTADRISSRNISCKEVWKTVAELFL